MSALEEIRDGPLLAEREVTHVSCVSSLRQCVFDRVWLAERGPHLARVGLDKSRHAGRRKNIVADRKHILVRSR